MQLSDTGRLSLIGNGRRDESIAIAMAKLDQALGALFDQAKLAPCKT